VLRFVVNRHHARTLHFDLRLEVDGTLPSWAVPKGPSTDPATKRLAVRVDDHELEHLDLEDEHKVVWDTGTFEPVGDPARGLEDGHLRFVLDGTKLRGGFALTRTAMGGDRRNWLLVKVADEHAEPGRLWTRPEQASVLTGRLLDVDTHSAPPPEG
jgi:DNA ligase D-like protein (predicted 3'-phosphoesterase)